MKSRNFLLGAGVAVGVIVILAGWQMFNQTYTFKGSLIDPPVQAADFELMDQHGDTFQLSDHSGKVVLVFFGYSSCPDVCPVTLSDYIQIKRDLGKDADQVEFVFITVDPERDTPERLAKYISNFDPTFIALSGTRAELEPVWQNYGVYQEKRDVGSAAGYLVDHTARTYAIDPQGNWRLTYPFEMDRNAILDDVRHLIQEG